MRTLHTEHSEALNDHGQAAEADRVRKVKIESDACAMWNALTAAEKRQAEPNAGREIRGKRDADPLEVIAELRAELEDARTQHDEDVTRISMLQDEVMDLRAQATITDAEIDECGHGKSIAALIAKIEAQEDRITYLETRMAPADLFRV